MDTLYYDAEGGLARYTAWTYSDGRRVYVFTRVSEDRILDYAKRYRYRAIKVSSNPK